jgi:hypothetical protein
MPAFHRSGPAAPTNRTRWPRIRAPRSVAAMAEGKRGGPNSTPVQLIFLAAAVVPSPVRASGEPVEEAGDGGFGGGLQTAVAVAYR